MKSFSKGNLDFVLNSVFMRIYGSIHDAFLNSNIRWIFPSFIPTDRYSCRFLKCITYLFLDLKFGTSSRYWACCYLQVGLTGSQTTSFVLLLIAPGPVGSHYASCGARRDILGLFQDATLAWFFGRLSTHFKPEYGSGWLMALP